MAFELHEDAEVQGLADLIDPRSTDERRFIILSGKPGGGRSSLLAAAVRRVREAGQPVLFSRLDFDGFEPDVMSPQDYVAYQFSKQVFYVRYPVRVKPRALFTTYKRFGRGLAVLSQMPLRI